VSLSLSPQKRQKHRENPTPQLARDDVKAPCKNRALHAIPRQPIKPVMSAPFSASFLGALTVAERSKINSSSSGFKGIRDGILKLTQFVVESKKSWLSLFYEDSNAYIGLYTDNPDVPVFAKNFDDVYCWSLRGGGGGCTETWTANTSISKFLKSAVVQKPEIAEAKFHALMRIDLADLTLQNYDAHSLKVFNTMQKIVKSFWNESFTELLAPLCPGRDVILNLTINKKQLRSIKIKPWTTARRIPAGSSGPRFIQVHDASTNLNDSAFEMGLDFLKSTLIVRDFDHEEYQYSLKDSLKRVEDFQFEFVTVAQSPNRTAFRPIDAPADESCDETPKPEIGTYHLPIMPSHLIESSYEFFRSIDASKINPDIFASTEVLRLGLPEYFARKYVGMDPFKGYAGLGWTRARKIMILFSKIVSHVITTATANWASESVPSSWTVGIFSENTEYIKTAAMTSASQFASLSTGTSFETLRPVLTGTVPKIVEIGQGVAPSTGSPLPPSTVFALNLADYTISAPFLSDANLKMILMDCVVDLVNKEFCINDRSRLSFLCIAGSAYIDDPPPTAAPPAAKPTQAAAASAAPERSPAASSAAPATVVHRNKGDRYSTVKYAWDSLQYPSVVYAPSSVKQKKLKSLLSDIRGNRFAKPPKGTCRVGGNNRDPEAKKPHLLREMQEAAGCGISRDEFLNILNSTDIFYTKTPGSARIVTDGDETEPEAQPSAAPAEPVFREGMTLGEMQQQMLQYKKSSMIESGIALPADAPEAKKPAAKKRRYDDDEDWTERRAPSGRAVRKCYAEDDGQDD
jgi:hypothetical protein